jgi:murein DD-endopeptidase MepM/ murein hydrolase activator NlpD
MRFLLGLVLILLLAAGGAYVVAGRMAGPPIQIVKPDKIVGVSSPLEVAVEAPGARLEALNIVLEQNGKQFPCSRSPIRRAPRSSRRGGQAADQPRDRQAVGARAAVGQRGRHRLCLAQGGLRHPHGPPRPRATTSRCASNGPGCRWCPTHHYINHGGSEMIVYRASPEDVTSGVAVGDVEYPGYPAAGATIAGVKITDAAMRVAFFALLHDQDLKAPIRLFARDEAGNTARADFDYRVFPKPFKKEPHRRRRQAARPRRARHLEGTTEVKPDGDTLAKFLVINGELRQKNNAKIASFAAQTKPELLWGGAVFHPFGNTAVESAFADHRTYIYKGKEVDQQVHLGFDLASYAGTPIVSANRGIVVFAEELGIYGNCVIIDHGFGVQSLYGHLSSIDVKAGQTSKRNSRSAAAA